MKKMKLIGEILILCGLLIILICVAGCLPIISIGVGADTPISKTGKDLIIYSGRK